MDVLSYGWRQGGQPDPDGATLAAVRKHYRESTSSRVSVADGDRGLFWDHVSVPQNNHLNQRSDGERRIFKAALGAMGNLYASVTGTSVLMLDARRMPASPNAFSGVLKFFGQEFDPDGSLIGPTKFRVLFEGTEEAAETQLISMVQRAHEAMDSSPAVELTIMSLWRDTASYQVIVRFGSMAQADYVANAFKDLQRGQQTYLKDCDLVYNSLPCARPD